MQLEITEAERLLLFQAIHDLMMKHHEEGRNDRHGIPARIQARKCYALKQRLLTLK